MKQPHYKQAIIQLNDFNITVAGVELGLGVFLTFIKSHLPPVTWHGNVAMRNTQQQYFEKNFGEPHYIYCRILKFKPQDFIEQTCKELWMMREWVISAEIQSNHMCDHERDGTTCVKDGLVPSLGGWRVNYFVPHRKVFHLLKYTTSAQQVPILN